MKNNYCGKCECEMCNNKQYKCSKRVTIWKNALLFCSSSQCERKIVYYIRKATEPSHSCKSVLSNTPVRRTQAWEHFSTFYIYLFLNFFLLKFIVLFSISDIVIIYDVYYYCTFIPRGIGCIIGVG